MNRSACRNHGFPCITCGDEAFRKCYASMIEELEQFMTEMKDKLDLLIHTSHE